MGLGDQSYNFASVQSLSGTSDTVTTNVFDAGSAVKLFGSPGRQNLKFSAYFTGITGTNPTMRARFVAADSADLATNPIILDDTGVSRAIVAADNGQWFDELIPGLQADAKRYYGVITTMGGTSPVASFTCQGMWAIQSAGAPNLQNI